jgi:hypothetical protein
MCWLGFEHGAGVHVILSRRRPAPSSGMDVPDSESRLLSVSAEPVEGAFKEKERRVFEGRG